MDNNTSTTVTRSVDHTTSQILTVLTYSDLEMLYSFFMDQMEQIDRKSNLTYESIVNNVLFYLIGMVEINKNKDTDNSKPDKANNLEHKITIDTVNPTNVRSMMYRINDIIKEYGTINKSDFMGIASIYLGDVDSMSQSFTSLPDIDSDENTKESLESSKRDSVILNNFEIDMMLNRIETSTDGEVVYPSSTARPSSTACPSSTARPSSTTPPSSEYSHASGVRNNNQKNQLKSMLEQKKRANKIFKSSDSDIVSAANPYSTYESVRSVKNTYAMEYEDTACCVDDFNYTEDTDCTSKCEYQSDSDNLNDTGDTDTNDYYEDDFSIDTTDYEYDDMGLERVERHHDGGIPQNVSYSATSMDKSREDITEDDFDALIAELLQNHGVSNQSQYEQELEDYDDSDGLNESNTLREIRIGIFRLLSGAAYRVFRPNYSTNKKDDPYLFDDFVDLVKNTINMVIDMRIVPRFKHRYLRQLNSLVEKEYRRLCARVDHCAVHNCTPSSCTHLNIHDREDKTNLIHSDLLSRIEDLKYVKSRAETISKMKLKKRSVYKDLDIDLLTKEIEQINTKVCKMPYIDFMKRYSCVLIRDRKNKRNSININAILNKHNSSTGKRTSPNASLYRTSQYTPGALVKNSFWYDEFAPLLLRGMAADPTDDHWESLIDINEDRIYGLVDKWYLENSKELMVHCNDLVEIYDSLTITEKIMMKRSWDMIRDYMVEFQVKLELNTTEERDLSQYVPFIDSILNRSYVRDHGMRLTMPFFIGPPVWTFLHSIPEIIDAIITDQDDIKDAIDDFKDYIILFLRMYPCPYCRHHINDFVKLNHEIFNYPLEYTLLGLDMKDSGDKMTDIFSLNIYSKLDTINNLNDLRLFLWKFHNAVTSSVHSRTRSKFITDRTKSIRNMKSSIELDDQTDRKRTNESIDDVIDSINSDTDFHNCEPSTEQSIFSLTQLIDPRSIKKTSDIDSETADSETADSESVENDPVKSEPVEREPVRSELDESEKDSGNETNGNKTKRVKINSPTASTERRVKKQNREFRSRQGISTQPFKSWRLDNAYAERYWPTPLLIDNISRSNTKSIEYYTKDLMHAKSYIACVRTLSCMRDDFIDIVKRCKTNEFERDTANEEDTQECKKKMKYLVEQIIEQIKSLDNIVLESKMLSERYTVIGADGIKIGDDTQLNTGILDNRKRTQRNIRNIGTNANVNTLKNSRGNYDNNKSLKREKSPKQFGPSGQIESAEPVSLKKSMKNINPNDFDWYRESKNRESKNREIRKGYGTISSAGQSPMERSPMERSPINSKRPYYTYANRSRPNGITTTYNTGYNTPFESEYMTGYNSLYESGNNTGYNTGYTSNVETPEESSIYQNISDVLDKKTSSNSNTDLTDVNIPQSKVIKSKRRFLTIRSRKKNRHYSQNDQNDQNDKTNHGSHSRSKSTDSRPYSKVFSRMMHKLDWKKKHRKDKSAESFSGSASGSFSGSISINDYSDKLKSIEEERKFKMAEKVGPPPIYIPSPITQSATSIEDDELNKQMQMLDDEMKCLDKEINPVIEVDEEIKEEEKEEIKNDRDPDIEHNENSSVYTPIPPLPSIDPSLLESKTDPLSGPKTDPLLESKTDVSRSEEAGDKDTITIKNIDFERPKTIERTLRTTRKYGGQRKRVSSMSMIDFDFNS